MSSTNTRTHVVISNTELGEMTDHEREQRQTSDDQIQLTNHQSKPTKMCNTALNSTYSARMFAWKPNPVQAHIEIIVPVEVV